MSGLLMTHILCVFHDLRPENTPLKAKLCMRITLKKFSLSIWTPPILINALLNAFEICKTDIAAREVRINEELSVYHELRIFLWSKHCTAIQLGVAAHLLPVWWCKHKNTTHNSIFSNRSHDKVDVWWTHFIFSVKTGKAFEGNKYFNLWHFSRNAHGDWSRSLKIQWESMCKVSLPHIK